MPERPHRSRSASRFIAELESDFEPVTFQDLLLQGAAKGYAVKTFREVEFNSQWDRTRPEDGCLTYTSKGKEGEKRAALIVVLPDGKKQAHSDFSKGREVYVCGNIIHIPPL